jgi:hypothetical protein
MENKHTPEPWKKFAFEVYDSEDKIIADCGYSNDYWGKDVCKDNAARIVACVNFCANIPNEQLEGTTLEAILKDYAMMRSYIETMGGAS